MTRLQELQAKKKALRAEYLKAMSNLDTQIAETREERKAEIVARKLAKDQKAEQRALRAHDKLMEAKRKLEERTQWMAAKVERKGLTLAKWREEQIAAGIAH